MSEKYLEKMEALIEKNGFTMLSILAVEAVPEFTYTVGLASKGLPEVIMCGVAPRVAQAILGATVQRLMEGKAQIGADLHEIANFPVRLIEVAMLHAEALMLIAMDRASARGDAFKAMQLIYPDENGHFPGDLKCSVRVAQIQDLDFVRGQGKPPVVH